MLGCFATKHFLRLSSFDKRHRLDKNGHAHDSHENLMLGVHHTVLAFCGELHGSQHPPMRFLGQFQNLHSECGDTECHRKRTFKILRARIAHAAPSDNRCLTLHGNSRERNSVTWTVCVPVPCGKSRHIQLVATLA